MPSMPYDDDCVYGSVPMPYRNPESCVTMPDFETVRRAAQLRSSPHLCAPHKDPYSSSTPVVVDGCSRAGLEPGAE
jgi:hypothetical protein